MGSPSSPAAPWYREVTRYQWLVLAIASAGWIFDIFEGQIFVSLKPQFLPALADPADRELLFNLGLAAFLVGGALGGIVFGMLADRWGRRQTMTVTILTYSAFTGLTCLVQDDWQLVVLRFLVGLGIGGEWAVAAAAVAEVFSGRARANASGIFHASSVLGTFLAIGAAGLVLQYGGTDSWRLGFLIGLAPALLVAWVRISMREPESWLAARKKAQQDTSRQLGRLRDLFATPKIRRNTLLGTALGIIGLATFWGIHIRGFDLLRSARVSQLSAEAWIPKSEANASADSFRLFGMILTTLGGGIGLLSFAPISQGVGRRNAFLFFHLAGFVLTLLVCWQAYSVPVLLGLLPIFGFCTLGMHAGYAVYFPELFPTRLRGTGAGFCFNTARVVAGPVLFGFGFLAEKPLFLGLPLAMLILSSLFLVGAGLVLLAPETRGKPLPE